MEVLNFGMKYSQAHASENMVLEQATDDKHDDDEQDDEKSTRSFSSVLDVFRSI